MFKILNLLFLLILFNVCQAQTSFDIEWSELEITNGKLMQIIPAGSDEYYTLRWSGGRIAGTYKISKYKNLQLERSEKIKLVVNKSYANFEGVRVVNGKFAVFLSDKWDGHDNFYIQYYIKFS